MIHPLRALARSWFAARKLRLPIDRRALVLEVGSGDSPCPRSDVLFDLTLANHERVGGPTVVDRPTVLGFVERLPFRDKAFDYVIAFHVLEHSANPQAFLNELQRVARAGYIETPSFWWERINPLTMHRLEVGLESYEGRHRLVVNQKRSPVPDPELSAQFRRPFEAVRGAVYPATIATQYYWTERIDFRILNPDYVIDWAPPRR
jgi:SAM-dependent methyltransferase